MYLSLLSSMLLCLQCVNYIHAHSPGCRYALPWAMCFCAYSSTITDMNIRIRIFNFCTSNWTPYLIS